MRQGSRNSRLYEDRPIADSRLGEYSRLGARDHDRTSGAEVAPAMRQDRSVSIPGTPTGACTLKRELRENIEN